MTQHAPRAGRTTWRRLARVLAPAVLIGTLATGAPAASQDAPSRPKPPSEPADVAVVPCSTGCRVVLSGRSQGRADAEPGAVPAGRCRTTRPDRRPASRERATRRAPSVSRWRRSTRRPGVGGRRPSAAPHAVTGGNLVEADVAPSRLAELAGADGVQLVREPRRPSTSRRVRGRRDHHRRRRLADRPASRRRRQRGRDRRRLHRLRGPPRHRAAGGGRRRTSVAAAARSPSSTAPPSPRSSTTWRPTPRCGWSASTPTSSSSTPSTPFRRTVDVVNSSLGWTLLDRGDGSGPIAAAVGSGPRDRGVLVVVAAGNYGNGPDCGTHRHQNASGDTPGPEPRRPRQHARWRRRPGLPGRRRRDGVRVAPVGRLARPPLRTSTCTSENVDGNIVARQRGRPGRDRWQRPADRGRRRHEHDRSGPQIYFVLVNRFAGTRHAAPRPLLRRRRARASRHPPASSITDPAVVAGAMAVGAHCYADGAVESFSCRGPDDRRAGRSPTSRGPTPPRAACTARADGCAEPGSSAPPPRPRTWPEPPPRCSRRTRPRRRRAPAAARGPRRRTPARPGSTTPTAPGGSASAPPATRYRPRPRRSRGMAPDAPVRQPAGHAVPVREPRTAPRRSRPNGTLRGRRSRGDRRRPRRRDRGGPQRHRRRPHAPPGYVTVFPGRHRRPTCVQPQLRRRADRRGPRHRHGRPTTTASRLVQRRRQHPPASSTSPAGTDPPATAVRAPIGSRRSPAPRGRWTPVPAPLGYAESARPAVAPPRSEPGQTLDVQVAGAGRRPRRRHRRRS